MRWRWSLVVAAVMLAGSVVLPGHNETHLPLRPPAGQTHLTQAQALDSARSSRGEPAAARLMDYRSATGLVGIGPNPALSPTAEVWVVTVRQPQEYTVILDGADGKVLNSCIGCPAL